MKALKLTIACALLSSCALAKSSFEIASQLVDDPSKNTKLAVLFSRSDNRPNIKQISQALKMNGLLQYAYEESTQQRVSFAANAHASMMLKIIASAFEQIGISYYLPSDYEKSGDFITLGFMINSKTMVDPGALYLVLANMGVIITDVSRNGVDFAYELDFSHAQLIAMASVEPQSELMLKKPLEDYFIELKALKKLLITPAPNDIWYPRVLFLDKNLNLITSYTSDLRAKELSIAVPKNSQFAIIGDQFSLENIKHGLKISGI